ncbi:hypothetical protein PYCC9005_005038 [Savitreella phatthalungensis]
MPYSAYSLLARECLETFTGGLFPSLGLHTLHELEEQHHPPQQQQQQQHARRTPVSNAYRPDRAPTTRQHPHQHRDTMSEVGGYTSAYTSRRPPRTRPVDGKENRTPSVVNPLLLRKRTSVESLRSATGLGGSWKGVPYSQTSTSLASLAAADQNANKPLPLPLPPTARPDRVRTSSGGSHHHHAHTSTTSRSRSRTPVTTHPQPDAFTAAADRAAEKDELASLGIEADRAGIVPDYGVSLAEPVTAGMATASVAVDMRVFHDRDAHETLRLQQQQQQQQQQSSRAGSGIREGKIRKPTPSIAGSVRTTRSDAQKVLAMGYALRLMGDKTAAPTIGAGSKRHGTKDPVEGSVRSVMVRAAQAIDRAASQAGSQFGGSRYAGSLYRLDKIAAGEISPARAKLPGEHTNVADAQEETASKYGGYTPSVALKQRHRLQQQHHQRHHQYSQPPPSLPRSTAASVKLDATLPLWGF